MALLVPTECRACACHRSAPLCGIDDEEGLAERIVLDRKECARQSEFPRSLYKSPSGISFSGKVRGLDSFDQAGELICSANAMCCFPLIYKEAHWRVLIPKNVKRIDHIIEAQPDCLSDEGLFCDLPRHGEAEFARHLRPLGVPANATERAVRGQNRSPKRDGVYRAEQRGESRLVSTRTKEVGRELLIGKLRAESGKQTMVNTRKEVDMGWWKVSEILVAQGHRELGEEVMRFISRMPPPRSDREMIAEKLRKHHRDARAPEGPTL